MQRKAAHLAVLVLLPAAVGGCGSSKSAATKAPSPNAAEKSPPGDIPDNQAFVRFAMPGGGFSVEVPEGWARTGGGARVTFAANLNSVTIERGTANGVPNSGSVKRSDIPALARRTPGFKLQSVAPVRRAGGTAIRIRYLQKSKPNAVTGKAVTDAVERYVYTHGGRRAILTLAGSKGADNVDPWRTISDSLRWTG
jgi:hypothetical protein